MTKSARIGKTIFMTIVFLAMVGGSIQIKFRHIEYGMPNDLIFDIIYYGIAVGCYILMIYSIWAGKSDNSQASTNNKHFDAGSGWYPIEPIGSKNMSKPFFD